ncbi:MAG: replication-associated recombination protein A [Clostridiales bacterium]|nr:replication-associated recombination protein A [Clostridiales bacterium]
MPSPLADRIRPTTLDEVVGQTHILGEGKPLRKIIESARIPNMIFYGPSGIGKTTVARIIANSSNMRMHKLNGTSASIADIREVVAEVSTFAGSNGILLFLDEIQYLNKKQQQSLLEYIESGEITLIASTTENPYFYIYNAILSRSTVFEFSPVKEEDIASALGRALEFIQDDLKRELTIHDGVIEHISKGCGGDVRKAINTIEICALSAVAKDGEYHITLDLARELTQRSSMRYDRDGDEHYDLLSAFQKSIRGSDENAALHYMARLIEADDLISICRRLLVIASEDIGLAYPNAITIVKSCVDAANQLGFPEARIPLAQAVILLCTAPKSSTAINAIDAAIADIRDGNTGDIPMHIRDSHYGGAKKMGRGIEYKYPPNYPNSYVEQQYLPDSLKDRKYYEFGDNKIESAAKAYRKRITK